VLVTTCGRSSVLKVCCDVKLFTAWCVVQLNPELAVCLCVACFRFDKFNLKYNPFGQSRLREIFIKQVRAQHGC